MIGFNTNNNTNSNLKDLDKPNWSLLDFNFIGDCVDVLTFGAKKYGEYDWQTMANPTETYFAALMRHIVAWRNGEVTDPDTGKSHLAHAFCNLMFLNYFEREDKE